MTQQGTPRSNADATGMRLNLLDRAVVAGMALLGGVVGVVVGILAGLADSELIVTLAWLVPLGAVWVGRRMVAPKNCPLVGPICRGVSWHSRMVCAHDWLWREGRRRCSRLSGDGSLEHFPLHPRGNVHAAISVFGRKLPREAAEQ